VPAQAQAALGMPKDRSWRREYFRPVNLKGYKGKSFEGGKFSLSMNSKNHKNICDHYENFCQSHGRGGGKIKGPIHTPEIMTRTNRCSQNIVKEVIFPSGPIKTLYH